MPALTRRRLLFAAAGIASAPARAAVDPAIDDLIEERMKAAPMAGLQACLVWGNRIAWAKAYGWANIEQRFPMSANSVMNIASVTKIVTATALMQLWEKDKFDLDGPINNHLPFKVVHPQYPDTPITFRHLLTHRSAIQDGPAYSNSYSCGDPEAPLADWLRSYLVPGGAAYSEKENFCGWAPGAEFSYSNVAFGLAGLLVETIAGLPFARYCRAAIFDPLAMPRSSFLIADTPPRMVAIPYTPVVGGKPRGPILPKQGGPETEGFAPHCLYGFPNIPDGLLRTSSTQLAHLLIAYLNGGEYGNARVLRPETIARMLSDQSPTSAGKGKPPVQGLGWRQTGLGRAGTVWGHTGSDPGVSTAMYVRPSARNGVVLFANTGGAGSHLGRIAEQLLLQKV